MIKELKGKIDKTKEEKVNHNIKLEKNEIVNEIIELSTTNGDVNYKIKEDGIQLSFSGGKSKKELVSGELIPEDTKEVTGHDSPNYDKDGYTGTLEKYVHSGSYTPSHTKHVSGQSSSNYNSGGYSGTLSRYLYSGSYTPSDTKTVSKTVNKSVSGSFKWDGSEWVINSGPNKPSTYYYSSGGYSGNLRLDESSWQNALNYNAINTNDGDPPKRDGEYKGEIYNISLSLKDLKYSGTVTRPSSDTRVYKYKGNVTKPAVDTRIYKYKGEVIRPEQDTRKYDNFYYYDYLIIYDYSICKMIQLENINKDLLSPELSINSISDLRIVNDKLEFLCNGKWKKIKTK